MDAKVQYTCQPTCMTMFMMDCNCTKWNARGRQHYAIPTKYLTISENNMEYLENS